MKKLDTGLHQLKPRSYICQKDDPSSEIYILIAGEIEALTEDGIVIHTFASDGPGSDSGIISKDDGTFNLQALEKFTVLGEIGCLLEAPRSVTLRTGAAGARIYCLCKDSREFTDLFAGNPQFRMILTFNVANYIKLTNDRILEERKLHQNLLREISTNQSLADEIIPKAGMILASLPDGVSGRDEARALITDYRSYEDLEPALPPSISPVPLVDTLSAEAARGDGHADKASLEPAADFATVTFKEGEIICNQGEESDDIFVLLDGAVEVLVFDQVLDVIDKPGTFIGEISVLLGYRDSSQLTRTATLRAMIPTRLAVKKGSHFINGIKHKPAIIHILFKSLTEKLRGSDRVLGEIVRKTRHTRALMNDFKGPKILMKRLKAIVNRYPELAVRLLHTLSRVPD